MSAEQRAAAAVATAAAVFAVVTLAHKVLVCRSLRMRDIWVGDMVGAAGVTHPRVASVAARCRF